MKDTKKVDLAKITVLTNQQAIGFIPENQAIRTFPNPILQSAVFYGSS